MPIALLALPDLRLSPFQLLEVQLELPSETADFLEAACVGDGDGRVVGKDPKPVRLTGDYLGPAEDRQHAEGLAAIDEWLAGEADNPFAPSPIGTGYPMTLCQIVTDQDGLTTRAICPTLPAPMRFPEVTIHQSPVLRGPTGVPALANRWSPVPGPALASTRGPQYHGKDEPDRGQRTQMQPPTPDNAVDHIARVRASHPQSE